MTGRLTPLAFGLLALPLLAQETSKPDPRETTLQEVKVKKARRRERADGPVKGYRPTRSATATKTDTPLRDVPQSVQVVPEALVKDQGMKSMAEALRYVPGTSMNPGEGGRDQPVLRGISTSSDFFVDGVRDDALYFRDPYNAERIEVLKGASGMTFGRGGAGGVVNRVTKRPLEDRLLAGELRAGSYGLKRASLDASQRFQGFGLRVNAVGEDSKSFRDGFTLQRSGVNPVFDFAPGRDTWILVAFEHFDDRRTVDRGIPALNGRPFDTDVSTFFGNAAQSPGRAKVDAVSARLEQGLGEGLTLRSALRATRYATFRQNVQPGSVVDPATGKLRITAYNTANDRDNLFFQTDLEAKVKLGGMEHHLLAGVEVGRQSSESRRQTGYFGSAEFTLVDAKSPIATVTRWASKASDTNNEVTADILAFYAQDQVTLAPKWKAVLGLRQDRFKVTLDDRNAANVDLGRTDSVLSPRAGLVFQPDAASSYYLSWSYAFLPSSETLSLSAANADLKPEKGLNWELGGKWDLGAGFAVTAAAFRLDRADVKSKDPNDPTKLVLSGLQRTEGLELGVQGQLLPRWQVYAGYANLNARVLKATGGSATAAPVPVGTKVPLVPRSAASWWNKVDLDGGWSLGLGLVHQGEVFASTTNSVRVPGFTRADLAVFWQAHPKARLALNVENLTDRRYHATAGSDFNILFGAPRSASLTCAVAF